jgi:hypothetical protein
MPRTPLLNTAEVRKLQGAHKGYVPSAAFGEYYFRQKPEHVRLVGEAVMLWTNVETYLAVLLSALLRADTNATIAVYSTLRRSSPKHDAIAKAAEHTFDPIGRQFIEALLRHVKSVESERNDLAHGWWGICPGIEDGLAWLPQEHMTLTHVEFNKDLLGKAKIGNRAKQLEKMVENVAIYRLEDIQEIILRMRNLIVIINDYRGFISEFRGEPLHSLNEKAIRRLSGFAPIQEGLEVLRLRAERQNQKASSQEQTQSDPE